MIRNMKWLTFTPFRKLIGVLCLLWTPATASFLAQQPSQASLPSAPKPTAHLTDYGTDCAYENIFVGSAVSVGGTNTQPTFTSGITFGQYAAKPFSHSIAAAPQFELGVIGPLPGGYPLDGLASFNVQLATKAPNRDLFPFLTIGYTRMFVTGNAVNFGLGMDFGKHGYNRLIRVELRDYFLFTGPQQHVIGLRVGLGKLISD